MTYQPDHELEVLEVDETIPPRPEEEIADAGRLDVDAADGEAVAHPSMPMPSDDR